jgi:hypothetical protein
VKTRGRAHIARSSSHKHGRLSTICLLVSHCRRESEHPCLHIMRLTRHVPARSIRGLGRCYDGRTRGRSGAAFTMALSLGSIKSPTQYLCKLQRRLTHLDQPATRSATTSPRSRSSMRMRGKIGYRRIPTLRRATLIWRGIYVEPTLGVFLRWTV